MRITLSFFLLFFFLIYFVHCEFIIVDSSEDVDNFNKDTALNISDKVFNIFLDIKTSNTDIKVVYADIYNKYKLTIEESCSYVKELINGRNLKYLDEKETKEYIKSKNIYSFSIMVYIVSGEPEVIHEVYKKHPNYISYIVTCKEDEIFDNVEDVKQNKNVFHTNPTILSQLIIVFFICFFLFIGFYILISISTPKIFEEKQLIINKEH